VHHFELDPVGVVEERGVVTRDVVRELFRSALGLDVLCKDPFPALVDGVWRRCLEGDVVDAHSVTIVGDMMRF